MAIEEYCEELDAMLTASDEAALSLDEVHGFMSAALCGPRVLSFRDCVCAVFLPEETDAEESECELPADILEMLARLYEDTLRSIEDGSFLPIVSCEQGDGDEDDVDARLWCCGFLMGMEYNRASWKLDSGLVLDLLTPIILLADQKEFERAAKQLGSGSESLRQDLLEALPESVCALKDFFKKKQRSRRPASAAKAPAGKRRVTRR
jgi:yecA family protein